MTTARFCLLLCAVLLAVEVLLLLLLNTAWCPAAQEMGLFSRHLGLSRHAVNPFEIYRAVCLLTCGWCVCQIGTAYGSDST